MVFSLTSPAFGQGDQIPKKYTCDGDDISPPLRWTGAPDEALSFVIICDNPDTPGVFYHWGAYDIPGNWRGLDEGHSVETLANGFKQAINSFGRPGYAGPAPPRGHAPHAYHFRISALTIDMLPAGPAPRCEEIIALALPHEIAFSELVGFYSR